MPFCLRYIRLQVYILGVTKARRSVLLKTSSLLTLLLARAYAINCLVSDSGTPSAMIAITLMVGCFKADIDDAAALHIRQHKLVMTGNRKLLFSQNKIATTNTNLLKDAKLIKTSAVGCAAQAASILKMY